MRVLGMSFISYSYILALNEYRIFSTLFSATIEIFGSKMCGEIMHYTCQQFSTRLMQC